MTSLSREWRELVAVFYNILSGQKNTPTRSKRCIDTISGTLGIAISAMYIRKYFDRDSKTKVGRMKI